MTGGCFREEEYLDKSNFIASQLFTLHFLQKNCSHESLGFIPEALTCVCYCHHNQGSLPVSSWETNSSPDLIELNPDFFWICNMDGRREGSILAGMDSRENG